MHASQGLRASRRSPIRAAISFALAFAAAAFAGSTGFAADYPTKPIKAIVPFAAGGGTDVLARIWADAIGKRLGQRVLIENQAGGGGAPGTIAGIKADPDGYTLVFGVASTMAINPYAMKDVGYKATDLQPVAMVGFSPWLMVGSAKLPFKDVPGLIAYSRANPGQLSFATWTATNDIGRKAFTMQTKVDLLAVPYPGAVQALTDIVAGRTSITLLDISTVLPFIQSGDIRPLAMTSSQRTSILPDVPSIQEAGVKDYEVTSFVAVFAPLNTPKDIVDKLNKESVAALNDADVKKKMTDLGAEVLAWDVAKLTGFVASENARWSKMVKDTGSEPK